jgi:DNA polymerase-3 subunit beta
MRILCDRARLLDGVGIVSAAVPAKAIKRVLQNIHLRVAKDELRLFATDLEIAISTRIDQVKVEGSGDCLLPARELAAILRELSEPTVTLEADENRCRIETRSGTFTLMGDDPAEYPATFQGAEGEPVRIGAAALADLVRKTSFAAAREATRYAMNGVLCQVREEKLRMVGTDGRRLALAHRRLEGSSGPKAGVEHTAIVPVKVLASVVRALPPADSDAPPEAEASAGTSDAVAIRFGPSHISFSFGLSEVHARLIDGEFPQFDGVVPRTSETTAEFNRALFESSTRKAAILAGQDSRAVRFTLDASTLRLSSEVANVGTAEITMEADVKGPGGTDLYNPDYLLEFLKVTPIETLLFHFTDESSPCKFTVGEDYQYVIMPITGA